LSKPLSGVTITNKTNGKAVATNADGSFEIEANTGDLLEISYVGYHTTKLKSNQIKAPISMNLAIEAVDQSEIVVVGYGSQKKVNLTGAVSTVSGKALEKDQSPNTATLLQGRLPGLRLYRGQASRVQKVCS
jgi:hypothetical protein